ncbi:hypothetical protein A1O7_01274 [Cladophialophora yegresii CBS 114405]|uniref:Zn(2)-C6 fungal-type domain-containing protein n=1 Tax=Cladophialophora yegresii CBS 114405 TaxID=1182544 RepID=W9WIZ4_9EURO|nr:uncharacterized protein A1O7_01274 [Cladophialophora yegresii CBS 114405]EXJ64935.1 hypothetical protein A1O7_01274 [Cladophialophora yegresii CBS 114405]
MSTTADSPETPPGGSQRQRSKPPRMLACVLCSQRKVKCDRQLPCSNCIKFRAQCVPATLVPRQKRRRFPERELLDRLRKYEELLHQNHIAFEPLHKESGRQSTIESSKGHDSDGADTLTPSLLARFGSHYGAKNILHSMTQSLGDDGNNSDSSQDDGVQVMAIKEAWEQSPEHADHLLFGSRGAAVDVSSLHPDTVQIFRLWQVYLDNVNPLLKVTHIPSMQGRIINAISQITAIDPILEALMFSIYCTAILSLSEEECQTMAGSPKEQLLTRYQYACQQALLNCGFLRTNDRECLTALFLYLISLQPSAVPQSLHSMLGVAIRIAQRMGIHCESALADCTVFEAEIRRRLWWSLTLFDSRIGQLASSKTVTLDPTWDCKIPLNVNDPDLRPEMKEPPTIQGGATEAIFAVVRSEVADFVRYSESHLDFTSPALKIIAKQHPRVGTTAEAADLATMEAVIQDRYLKSCDPENPIHFMTIWTTRSSLAKCRLMDDYVKHSGPSLRWTGEQREAALSHALTMLECDTRIMSSPLSGRFRWFNHFYFPFLAYIHIIQDLKRRPMSEQARHAWEVMSDNYEAWFGALFRDGDSPVFQMFAKLILGTWHACATTAERSGETLVPPRIVYFLKSRLAHMGEAALATSHTEQAGPSMSSGMDEFSVSMDPMDFSHQSQPAITKLQGGNGTMESEMYPGPHMRNQLEWATLGGWPGWGSF